MLALERLVENIKIGKNKKVYVVIKPILIILHYKRIYKETAVKRRKSDVKKYILCLSIFHNQAF